MRKLVKFLHTMASIGYMGALAALILLHLSLPEPEVLERFATLRIVQGEVAQWLLLPSMALVLISGLLSAAITPGFHDAGWMWAKLLSGVLVFEGTLAYVQAPMERAAVRAQMALDGDLAVTELGTRLANEWGPLWILFAVAVANVALGVWRPYIWPKIARSPRTTAPEDGSRGVEPDADGVSRADGSADATPEPGTGATGGADRYDGDLYHV